MLGLYTDCTDAIRDATFAKMHCVGWNSREGYWCIYKPTEKIPEYIKPEFLCTITGQLPIPLSESAVEIWQSVVKSLA